jgi:8-oxo-dGTP pyrophosphatase MutT (NUDIX family)
MQTDEILDLVDENDHVIGTIARSDFYRLEQDKIGFIREVALFIQNSDGKFWIPTRTLDKKIAPGGLDYSMGGHVSAGETYLDAAHREIKEELNLDIPVGDLEVIATYTPKAIPYFRTLYVYKSDIAPEYNKNDFSGAEWLSLVELKAKIRSGLPAKTSLIETVELL